MSKLTNLINELNPVMAGSTTSDQVERIIRDHSVAACAAGLASGVLPGVGSIIATLTSAGAIWSMYYRICQKLNIHISENVLKTLGSAFLTNIVTQLGGVLLIELAASFVPGVALVASASICYGVTYVAGYLFIQLLVNVFKAGKRPDQLSAEELKAMGRAAGEQIHCKTIFKDAQADAKAQIHRGEITKEGAA